MKVEKFRAEAERFFETDASATLSNQNLGVHVIKSVLSDKIESAFWPKIRLERNFAIKLLVIQLKQTKLQCSKWI